MSAVSRVIHRRQWALTGGLSGLLAGAAAVAVSEAVAAVLTGVTSPLLAVGNRVVDATPRPVKELAIERFGTNDKAALIGGMVLTVALLAAVLGGVGVRRPRVALYAFLMLSLVAGLAAVTDRAATASLLLRLLPPLALAGVGATALLMLLRTLRAPAVSLPGGTRAATAPTGTEGSAATHPRHDDEIENDFDRRRFLQAAVAVGAVSALGAVTRQVSGGSAAAAERAGLTLPRAASPAAPLPPGAALDVPGISAFLTPTRDFYRVDTALRVPDVPIDGYTLRIHGLVDRPLELNFEELLSRRLVERRITLTCVSNPVGGPYVGNATWLGVPVRDLLEEAGVRPGADAVKSTSADDMTIGTPLQPLTDPGRDALIAVGMNGRPLPLAHGFPVRMVVPGLYGYVSATKWLVDLEVTRFADFRAYWSTRGYSAKAPIKTSSRIDVPRSFARLRRGPVTVAGVAWSQDRGVTAVEVRVDGGRWHPADLAAAAGVDTWRQWRWTWDASPGTHTLEVRATDATGYTQTSARAPIAPNGSTGWHSVNVSVA
jgi:DMSO/TMAO reductase YedYZ molybdopterin-dependent catalytic subunit